MKDETVGSDLGGVADSSCTVYALHKGFLVPGRAKTGSSLEKRAEILFSEPAVCPSVVLHPPQGALSPTSLQRSTFPHFSEGIL